MASRKQRRVREFWELVSVRGSEECWPFLGSHDRNGYGKFRGELAHREAMRICGHDLGDLCVCHHCDNPMCVNPRHLFLGTHEDNMRDRDRKDRVASGERVGGAKLSADDVTEIRRMLSCGEAQQDVAQVFGVHNSTVSDIRTGKTWRGH